MDSWHKWGHYYSSVGDENIFDFLCNKNLFPWSMCNYYEIGDFSEFSQLRSQYTGGYGSQI
jgi:hypothetical protein